MLTLSALSIPKFIDQAKDTTNKGQVIFDDLLSNVNQGGSTGGVIPTPEPTPPPGEVKACEKAFNVNSGLTWDSEGYTYTYTPKQTDAIFSSDGYKLEAKSTSTTSIPSVQPCTTVQSGDTVLNVNSYANMYSYNGATSIDVDFGKWDTSRVLYMNRMFNGSQATSIKYLGGLRTGSVKDMGYMFYSSRATSLDLSNFNTSNVTNMGSMFTLSKATSLDLSSFDTGNVTEMGYMFSSSDATTINVRNFNTSNVTNMRSMFQNSQATSLDLSSFDTGNVKEATNMFRGSSAMYPSKLQSLTIGGKFRVLGISNRGGMFDNRNYSLVVRSTDEESLTQINSAFGVTTEIIK